MNKKRDLLIITGIYLLAFILGFVASLWVKKIFMKLLVFDVIATIVTFIFSVILHNSSVYDAYWSLTPLVMGIWLFAAENAFGIMQILFLIAFNIWAVRLTLNWVHVFTDFSYEDWRYRKFRNDTPKIFWPIVNFFGIHMMPTVLVFLGMLPMFVIASEGIGVISIIGIAVMLVGVLLEHFADKAMHEFLGNSTSGSVCTYGLWRFSRHPNYLGEITFWLGVFLAMLPYAMNRWYLGVGFLSMVFLFNVISIPLMEKRQMRRRPAYAEYRKQTHRLLILPMKKI